MSNHLHKDFKKWWKKVDDGTATKMEKTIAIMAWHHQQKKIDELEMEIEFRNLGVN